MAAGSRTPKPRSLNTVVPTSTCALIDTASFDPVPRACDSRWRQWCSDASTVSAARRGLSSKYLSNLEPVGRSSHLDRPRVAAEQEQFCRDLRGQAVGVVCRTEVMAGATVAYEKPGQSHIPRSSCWAY